MERTDNRAGITECINAVSQLRSLRKRGVAINGEGQFALGGLLVVLGKEIGLAGNLSNENLEIFGRLVRLGVRVNDFIDICPFLVEQMERSRSDEEVLLRLNEEYFQLRDKFEKEMLGLPESVAGVVRSYLISVVRLDSFYKKEENWTEEKIIWHKQMENGVSLVHTAAILFPEFEKMCRVRIDHGKDEFEEVFGWLAKKEPVSDIQSRLRALFDMAMMSQIVDDMIDIDIDKKLGLVTLAQVLNDKAIRQLYSEYEMDAIRRGVGAEVVKAALTIFRMAKKAMRLQGGRLGGKRERMFLS